MADNRLILRCVVCSEEVVIANQYGVDWLASHAVRENNDSSVDAFLYDHGLCGECGEQFKMVVEHPREGHCKYLLTTEPICAILIAQ